MKNAWRVTILLAVSFLAASCTDKEPIRIGFIGELSGYSADLGEAARNGALLAIEQLNEQGGIKGQPVELLVRDVGSTAESALKAAGELQNAKVVAVIGPTTSSIAATLVPFHDSAKLVLLSPTVSAQKFFGHDDYFFRINGTMRDNAQLNAGYHLERGVRRLSAAVNQNNPVYAGNTVAEFKLAFEQKGGELVSTQNFDSAAESLLPVVQKLLESRPDGILLVANASDTARLTQQVRKLDPHIPLLITEWASTDQLIELGGNAVEGLVVPLQFDPEYHSPRYDDFSSVT